MKLHMHMQVHEAGARGITGLLATGLGQPYRPSRASVVLASMGQRKHRSYACAACSMLRAVRETGLRCEICTPQAD